MSPFKKALLFLLGKYYRTLKLRWHFPKLVSRADSFISDSKLSFFVRGRRFELKHGSDDEMEWFFLAAVEPNGDCDWVDCIGIGPARYEQWALEAIANRK
jgi:hypothetical protein